ncbi:MAG: peptidylprolyl isomerase, partial [Bacteroidota bacterium]
RNSVSGSTLQEVAASQNVTVQSANAVTRSAPTLPEAGSEPVVVGAAFGKEIGEMTGLIDGENGVFMVQVINIIKAPDLENYNNYSNQLQQSSNGVIGNSVFQALKKAADIEDNRADFY